MMHEGYIYYAIFGLMLAVVVVLAMMRRFKYSPAVIVTAFLVMLFSSFVMSVDLMSRPRPVDLMLPHQVPDVEKAQILADWMKEDEYIMLLLHWEGLEYPRYFQFPWSDQLAEEIEQAKQGAAGSGAPGIEMLIPFDNSLDRREHPWVDVMPQPKEMFPKGNATPEVQEYQHPGDDA